MARAFKDFKSMVGQCYGRLKVVALDENHRYPRASCECECGNSGVFMAENILSGRTKSCGCLRNEKTTARSVRDPRRVAVTKILSIYRNGAKARSMKFNINRDDVERMIFSPCRYCGVEGAQELLIGNGRVVAHNGIDRVDNNVHYEPDNCVPCCKACNLAKRTMTLSEFKEWATRVANHMRNER